MHAIFQLFPRLLPTKSRCTSPLRNSPLTYSLCPSCHGLPCLSDHYLPNRSAKATRREMCLSIFYLPYVGGTHHVRSLYIRCGEWSQTIFHKLQIARWFGALIMEKWWQIKVQLWLTEEHINHPSIHPFAHGWWYSNSLKETKYTISISYVHTFVNFFMLSAFYRFIAAFSFDGN